jgi:catechol 2,3-dioxygenase-like lactoylglutathione lyase family enzyme
MLRNRGKCRQEQTVKRIAIVTLFAAAFGGCATLDHQDQLPEQPPEEPRKQSVQPKPTTEGTRMRLGNFSISLAVKDLKASRAFYEKLGFKTFGGDAAQGWLILQNDTATIGLFQGMFEKNLLTFNPGWDRSAKALKDFDDIRDIQKALKAKGIAPVTAADEASTGPASLVIADPDGNQILLDQHVPRPK